MHNVYDITLKGSLLSLVLLCKGTKNFLSQKQEMIITKEKTNKRPNYFTCLFNRKLISEDDI